LTPKTTSYGSKGPSPGEPVLLSSGKNEHLVMAGGEDLHTRKGIIELSQLSGILWGEKIRSHLGTEFVVLKPRAPDFFHHFRRSGAPMMPQDIGLVIALTGLGKEDAVLEAGTGSGVLSCYLGMVARSVLSYEEREDAARLAQKNMDMAGIDNVSIEVGNLTEELPRLAGAGEMFDVAVLDMGGAEEVIPLIKSVLAPGGCLACYSPFMEQMAAVHRAMEANGFLNVLSVEAILREQQVGHRGVRPSTRVGHTGYITTGRNTAVTM